MSTNYEIVNVFTTKTGVAININIDNEILPAFVDGKRWIAVKKLNGIGNIDDEVLIGSSIRFTTAEIVRKDETWSSEYHGTDGVYKNDKVRWTGNINIDLDTKSVASSARNTIILKLVNETLESKLIDEISAELDALI
jgi:hypothetical protein